MSSLPYLPQNTPGIRFDVEAFQGPFAHRIYNRDPNNPRIPRYVQNSNGFAPFDRVVVVADGDYKDKTGYIMNCNNQQQVCVKFDHDGYYKRFNAEDCFLIPWPQDEATKTVFNGKGDIAISAVEDRLVLIHTRAAYQPAENMPDTVVSSTTGVLNARTNSVSDTAANSNTNRENETEEGIENQATAASVRNRNESPPREQNIRPKKKRREE